MGKKGNKNKGIGRGLLIIIAILICAAVGLSMSGSGDDKAKEYLTESVTDQISLELRKKQPEVSDSIEISHMKQDDVLEKHYIVRLNHSDDMELLFRIDVESSTDGISEALKAKVYDITNDRVLLDDSLKNLDNKIYREMKTGNASKKNDTRYEITVYFDEPVGDKYAQSELEATFNWYVSEEDADKLITSKTGNVKVILYSFVFAVILILVLTIAFRKHLSERIFGDAEGPEQLEDNSKKLE